MQRLGKPFFAGRGESWIFSGIFLIACFLRIFPFQQLNDGSLYFFEAQAMNDASRPVAQIAAATLKDQAPLKYYLLHPLLYLGRDEFLLRFPALFFDLASMVLLYLLGRALFDRKTALLACFFMAVSMWNIHHATLARNYPLFIFWVLASTLFLHRATYRNKKIDWFFFTLASILAFYSFYPTSFFLAAQALWVFCLFGSRVDLLKRFMLALTGWAAAAFLSGPRLVEAFERKKAFGVFWSLRGHEAWEVLRDHFGGMTGGFSISALVFILSVFLTLRVREKRPALFLLLLLVFIPISLFLFCFYLFGISIAPRYFFLSYPFFLLVSAAGITACSCRIFRAIGITAFLLPLCLYGFYRTGLLGRDAMPEEYLRHDEDFKGIASFIAEHSDHLDFVIATDAPAVFGIQYYLDKENKSPVTALFKNPGTDPYYLYGTHEIFLCGVNGDQPALEFFANRGRLLVVDIVGHLDSFQYGEAILKWLRTHAYRTERAYGADFYFMPPPAHLAQDKTMLPAEAQRQFVAGADIAYRIIYPFNKPQHDFDDLALNEKGSR